MKQLLIRQGRVVVQELPAPVPAAGEILVRTAWSLISVGTETASLRSSVPIDPLTRWLHRARKAGEVIAMTMRRGLDETRAAVALRLEGPSVVTGYSLAGHVVGVGAGVHDLLAGQSVACAGSSCAHHAEIVAVPRSLAVPVPEGLELDRAAFVTVGAIALHGVRQAELALGEIACVVGLGLVGQLTVMLLRASGCRVVGVDLRPERVERAIALGLERGIVAPTEDVARAVDHVTGGRGVDAVLLTAATPSSDPIRQAVELVRRRGRIVVVGAVGMEIDRGALYAKEAEVRISCSYGPGRYDPSYEREGMDYPYAYVRWTENRNMEAFLRLAASGAIRLDTLVDRTFRIERAAEAFAALEASDGASPPLGVLLQYPAEQPGAVARAPRAVPVVVRRRPESGLGVALVGPGQFASAVHLPNLASLAPLASLRAVVARSSNAAREAGRAFAAAYATTELDEVLADDAIEVVLICTRHDTHAELARRALEAGKAVFLEKPAALDRASLDALERAVSNSGRPFALGLNRRFAPDSLAVAELLTRRSGPLFAHYHVNAGKLAGDHWALGPEGGGRLVGEACHMLDLLGHFVGRERTGHTIRALAPPPGRPDLPLGDNVAITLSYGDGSIAALTYTSLGHAGAGKERLELHWDGATAIISDFRALAVHGVAGRDVERPAPDKGQRELLRRFLEHAAGRGREPIAWEQIADVTRLTFDLVDDLRGRPAGG